MSDTFVLVPGQHTLTVDENQKVSRGENGGLLIYDNLSGSLSELPLSSEVLSFFNISLTDEILGSNMEKEFLINDSHSESETSEGRCTKLSKLNSATWNDKAIKLLFTLYKDHQDDFKNTAVKNDIVWDKIRTQMITDGYNFTKTQIKDKWTNMRKQYMRVKDHNKQTGVERKSYRYYDEMNELYGNKPSVNPVALASNMEKSDDENISSEHSTDNEQCRKKSKVERQLSTWTEKFIQHAKEREDRREHRHSERIVAIENATKAFRDVMEKLIDKL
ncbi:PREDICTED: uncharacterized protein LOC105570868 [Vollenhovia emeryi]|uniref:uncharacterized protein LOC105570868 n=1 Tax=Vollenhovia emeryi TaxID=411798 RepID=UPI0005F3BD83|nr:PREDICTED: uncharacterized protein LOC105570868 [Vollenhovia emeryi]